MLVSDDASGSAGGDALPLMTAFFLLREVRNARGGGESNKQPSSDEYW